MLKVRAPRSVLQPIEVGSSSELLVGQNVLAIGNPFGLDHTPTSGQEMGDSTSLQSGCSRSNARQKSIHALVSPREMIARPKMSQIEWKTIER